MAKTPTLQDITEGSFGSAGVHNQNYDNIEAAFENTLSRDGSTPNQMETDLDLNSNDLLNVGTLDTDTLTVDTLNVGTIDGGTASFTGVILNGETVTPDSLVAVPSTVLQDVADLAAFTRNTELGVVTMGNAVEGDIGLTYVWYYDPSDTTSTTLYPAVTVGADGARWKVAGPFIATTLAHANNMATVVPNGVEIIVKSHTTIGDGGGFTGTKISSADSKYPGDGFIQPTGEANPAMWGASASATASVNAGAIEKAIGSGLSSVVIKGNYSVDSIDATLIANATINFDNSTVLTRNDFGDYMMFRCDLAGFDLNITGGGVVDGDNKAPILVEFYNSVTTTSALNIERGPQWTNAYKRVLDGVGDTAGMQVRGRIQPTLRSVHVSNIDREIGAGVLGSSGSQGISIYQLNVGGTDYYPLSPEILDCRIDNVSSGEPQGGVNNADCDALLCFTGAGAIASGFAEDRCTVKNLKALNFKGRAIKLQSGMFDIDGVDFDIDNIFPITAGFQVVNCQVSGAGVIRGVRGTVQKGGSGDPFSSGYLGAIVSLYDAIDYGRATQSVSISDISVTCEVDAGEGFNSILEATTGHTVARTGATNMMNAVVHGSVNYLATFPPMSVQRAYNFQNIYANEIATAATATPTGGTTNPRVSMDMCGHFGSEVMACEERGTGNASRVTIDARALTNIEDHAPGLSSTYEGRGILYAKTIGGNKTSLGGLINVETEVLADDTTHAFRPCGYSVGTGLILIGTGFANRGGQTVLRADGSNLTEIDAYASTLFEIGSGSNPDVDGKINVWFANNADGLSVLHLKNRIGSSRSFIMVHIG